MRYLVTLTDMVCPGAATVLLSTPSGGRAQFLRGAEGVASIAMDLSDSDAGALAADGYALEPEPAEEED